ncbi:hypothetical protein AYO45_06890 [Gammaproteobacteria bacterium SCGC AG-212-F23]|nr:hypothetical protein AYO45_06890 [Gammaproteobacteria bacterium SCGC AG-212-F23]
MLPQNDPDSKKNTTANAEGDTAASTPATDAKTATSTTEFEKSFSAAVAKHDRQAMNQIRTEYLLSACRATQGELDLTAKEEKITFPDRDDIEQYRFPTNDQYITALNANKQLTTLTLHSLHYGLGESFIRLLPLANRTQWITQLKIARCRPSEDDLKALSTMQEKYNPDSKFSCIDIDVSYRESMQVLEVFSHCKSLTSLVIRVPGYLREDHIQCLKKQLHF